MTKTEAINTLKPIAYSLRAKHCWLKGKLSLLIGQVLVESSYLKHAPGNNCLGIKWTSRYPESRKQMLWTKEWIGGKYRPVKAPFVIFDSIEECIEEGYIRILMLDRYRETRKSPDWWEATNYVRLNGYATSPSYTETLRKTILSTRIYEIDWEHDPEEEIVPGLTPNFKRRETYSNVRMGRKTYYRVIEPYPEYDKSVKSLAIQLQKGRDAVGQPFIVTPNGCWFRQETYNILAGGAGRSQHKTANAVDIYTPRGLTTYQFYQVMKASTDCRGFGIGKNFLHIDRRKRQSLWFY